MGRIAHQAFVLLCDEELVVLAVQEDPCCEWHKTEGKSLAAIIDPEGLTSFFDFRLALKQNQRHVLGTLVMTTDGQRKKVFQCIGKQEGGQVTIIGFDERKRLEGDRATLEKDMHRHLDEMSSLNNEVINAKREVMQKNAEISRLLDQQRVLNARLEETIAMKDRLFSLLSHDLRSPIAGMMDLVSLLELGETTYSEILEMGLIASIRQLGGQTLDLLTDLTLWYKFTHEDGAIRRVPVAVSDMIDRMASHFGSIVKREHLQLRVSCEGEPYAEADERVLETVLRNLVSNAIKFTPAGGRIQISARDREEGVEITVSDSGVGMTEERLQGLFAIAPDNSERGVRGEKGLGLGLVLSRELLEQVDGRIEARSQLGKGSLFTVHLHRFRP